MKRFGNLWNKIISLDNLRLAENKARYGKSNSYGVKKFDKEGDRDEKLLSIQKSLIDKTYKTSEYTVFKVYEPKEREIYRLPYYPDRIVHHAILNILEPIFTKTFTYNTYSSIPGRGLSKCAERVHKIIWRYKSKQKRLYCLKIDIKKFYPSINHEVLKTIIRKKIKDSDVLWLLDEIIDSTGGLPIGNYTSQWFGNLYFCYFMHQINEKYPEIDCTEYADDIVFYSESPKKLHNIFREFIKPEIEENLKLVIKQNWQVFPVAYDRKDKHGRPLDYLGFKFYMNETTLRNRIKKNFSVAIKKLLKKNPEPEPKTIMMTISPWFGWIIHSNCSYLIKGCLGEKLYKRFYKEYKNRLKNVR